MPRLIYSPASLQDIARLRAFLAAQDQAAAKRAISAIRQSLRDLAKRLEIGRPARDMPAEFREWSIRFGRSGYVALYRFDGTLTVVLAIRHAREAGY